jgi:hypothetical protein
VAVTAGMTPNPEELARRFTAGLILERIDPPRVYEQPKPRGPEVPLGDYRDKMLDARIESLDKPGIYIDTSPTGSGKSHADIETTRRIRTSDAQDPDRNADTR